MIDPGASTSSTDPIAPFARHYPQQQQQQQQQQEHLRSRQRSRPLISPLTLVVTRRRGNNQPDNNNNFETSSVDPLTEPLLLLLPPERLTPREGGGGGGDIGAFLTTMRASVSNKAAAAAAATISNSSKSAANHHHHHHHDGEEGDREVLCCSDPLQDDVRSSLDDDDDERSRRQRRDDDDDDDDSSPIHHHHVPWYKNPYQRMAMISNFCTSYNVVNISLVLPILEQLHKTSRHGGVILSNNNDISTQDTSIVASSLLAGMIFGQVVGGALGDASWIGGLAGALRAVMVLQIVASLGSASVYLSSSSVMPPSMDHFYWELATWRFVLGIGAGAVYPLAACLSVEQAGCRSSGGNHVKSALKRVVRTFSMQGVGFWMVPAITLPLLCISSLPLQYTWRIILALGAVPGLVLLIMQWHLYRSLQTPAVAREQTRAAEEQEEDSKAEQQQQSPWRLNGAENDYDAEESHLMEGLTDPRQQQRSAPLPAPSSFASGMRRDQSASSFIGGVNQRHLSDRSSRDNLLFSASSGNDDAAAAAAEDSDGEVGTFLDSAPDLSSGGGCYGASEPPVIRYGWWASIVSEKNLCQKLLGTAATWFLFDVLFYGNTLFQAIVVEATFGAGNAKLNAYQDTSAADHARQELKRTATDSLILASIALPGYIVAGILIGRRVCGITQSVRFVMMQGFCCMSILYLTIGWYWTELRRRSPLLLVILYGMTFFFANYGPNTTTFVLPALVYSPECRSTWNGFSAAAGKLGALFGATFFAPAARQWGDATVMLVCAAIGAVAYIMTLCFVRIPPMQTEQEQRPAADGEDAQQQRRPSNITSNHEAAGVQPSSLDASVTQLPSTTQTVEDPTAAAIPADQGLHA